MSGEGGGGGIRNNNFRLNQLANRAITVIAGKFHACRIFLATVALSEAAAIAFVSIAVTYAKEELGLSPGEGKGASDATKLRM